LDVESQVTQRVELALTGIPHVIRVRSVSRASVSAVTLVFEPETDILLARELITQRLPGAREALPPGSGPPEMGPLSSGLGEVYHFTSSWPGHTLSELRTAIDWEVSPRLKTVSGVAEVNSWGGDKRQIVVQPDRSKLLANGVTELMLAEALGAGGQSSSGGMIERGEEGTFVRLDNSYRSVERIENQMVTVLENGANRRTVFVKDVARVVEGSAPRFSAATSDGKGETIYTMVQMLSGANAHRVVADVKTRLAELTPTLPLGLKIEPFYDRADFVEDVLKTVKRNLLEGGVIVAAVLFLMLGNWRAGLIVASVIPLSMLGAFWLMYYLGVSGNLLSLGAIDFGLVVDGSIVIIEGALAAMAAHKLDARRALARVGAEVGRPVSLAVGIIALVYVPVLLLEGVEGKMFRPMALTVLFALGTAFVLTFTWVPTLGALILQSEVHSEPGFMRALRSFYARRLAYVVDNPVAPIGALVLALVGGIFIVSRLGGEFVPRLEEGSLAIQLSRPPSVGLQQAIAGTRELELAIGKLPEVTRVVSRIGSPDVATDVMGIEQADVMVSLKPRDQWVSAKDAAGFAEVLGPALREALPGAGFGFTQPIEMRVQELIGGIQSDFGVKIFGDDLGTLRTLAEHVASTLAHVPGAADIRIEQTSGQHTVTLRPDPGKLAHNNVSLEDLKLHTQSLRQGTRVSEFLDGLRRFDVVVRQPPGGIEPFALAHDSLVSRSGELVAVGNLADIERVETPAQVSREQGRRRILIEANVRGRDLVSFVTEAQGKLTNLAMPESYFLEYGGQFENLSRAAKRLAVVVPITLALVFILLYFAFGRLMPATLVFISIPTAATGGAFALAIRGLDLSMSAAIGFLALFGVATLNGVVLLSAVLNQLESGTEVKTAIISASAERLRPVLTTALVAALGFVPMAIGTGTGSEVQRPLATVVIGGLVTSTLATLFILPLLSRKFLRRSA